LLGLAEGRYLLRDAEGEPADVLVVTLFGAPLAPRRMARKPRPRQADPDAGAPEVPLSRLTVISPDELGDAAAAAAWLEATTADADVLDGLIAAAVTVVNRAVYAHRAAAQDASGGDLSRGRAIRLRVGFGTGERLVDGKFNDAVEVPPETERRRRRTETLAPQERVAAVLGGHESLPACEAMLLRARADLDAGRSREAALQLRAGLEALVAEVTADGDAGQERDLAAVAERRPAVSAAADEAIAGNLSPDRAADVEAALEIGERILRRRRIMGQ
jgi:hypothetical protein